MKVVLFCCGPRQDPLSTDYAHQEPFGRGILEGDRRNAGRPAKRAVPASDWGRLIMTLLRRR
jgi:hypothetical protein